MLGVNLDDLGDHRPGQRGRGRARCRVPARRPRASPRPTCVRRRWRSVCARGTSRQPHAWPAGCRTERRSRSRLLARSTAPRRRCTRLGFAELRVRHYGDTARIEVDSTELAAVVAAAPRRRRRRHGPPATATSRSISRASAPATSTMQQSSPASDRSAQPPTGRPDEAVDDDQLLGRLQGGRATRRRAREGRARQSCGSPRRTASTRSARSATSPPRPSASRSAPASSTSTRAPRADRP